MREQGSRMCTRTQQQFSWHESSLGSSVFLDDALLLTVSRTWDKIGFVDFPEG